MKKQMNQVSESEIMAYTYQVALFFEPYILPSTNVLIEPRSPSKVARKLKNLAQLSDDFKAPAHCYTIVLEEQGTKIVGYGFGKDPFSAIREAKQKVLKQVDQLHDELISNQDRQIEINSALNNKQH